ncbi:hypothetical protein V502_08003 [Pseudogymnoascus sp. VKM F-4520 (FW-2644)]|nr:hypothetical protein V502_08003 [Pseudogymnoascus sp. VKM F-4520 (FW-2644)]
MRGRATPTPGDGLEVFPIENDNLSDFEIQRKSPPDVKGLYELMRAAQLPAGDRTLRLLLSQADSLSWALRLLLDSGLPAEAVSALVRGENSRKSKHAEFHQVPQKLPKQQKQLENPLGHIPPQILTANIKLLARFSLSTPRPNQPQQRTSTPPFTSSNNTLTPPPTPGTPSSPDVRHTRTYNHAVAPYWNSILQQSLHHLQHTGAEIDPDIFQYACYALYSTFAIRRHIPSARSEAEKSLPFIRELWKGISEPSEGVGGVGGALVHQVRGTHVLAYVRVLAVADCEAEMEGVLEWMVAYQDALGDVAGRRGKWI